MTKSSRYFILTTLLTLLVTSCTPVALLSASPQDMQRLRSEKQRLKSSGIPEHLPVDGLEELHYGDKVKDVQAVLGAGHRTSTGLSSIRITTLTYPERQQMFVFVNGRLTEIKKLEIKKL